MSQTVPDPLFTESPTQTNTVFVSKAGNDSNDGLTEKTPKLSIASALSVATALTPSASNKVSIQIVDAGTYSEQVILPDFVSLFGPSATVSAVAVSAVELGSQSTVHLYRAEGGNGVALEFDNSSDTGWATVDTIVVTGGNPALAIQNGILYATIKKIVSSGSGNGVLLATTGAAVLEVGEIEVDTGTGLQLAGSTNTVSGRIDKISNTGVGRGLGLASTVSGKADLVIGLIDCVTTYSVDASNTLSLLAADLVGTPGVVGGTADVTEAGAASGGPSEYVPYVQNTTPETATFTAVLGETHVVDTSSGGFTANLPAIASGQGRIGFYFSGTGGQLTLDPNALETIEGKTTIKLQQGHNTIENDGSGWLLVQKTGRANTRLDATPGATQDDYNPTDWGRDVTHLYLDPGSESTITGFEEDGFVGMDSVLVVNEGTANLVIASDSASSTAANRVLIESGIDATIEPNGVAELIRDGTANKWRLRLPGRIAVRSDAAGTDVLGTSGVPQALTSLSYTAQAGVTDTRDFGDCVWHVTCTAKSTATKLTVKVEWSEDGTNLSQQGSESITSGVSTLSEYIAEYDISGETAPFNLPAILLPVAAPNAKVSMIADAGTPSVYVRAWRKA